MESPPRELEEAVAAYQAASQQTRAFVIRCRYQGVVFDVSRRFAIADLPPLTFFHLVEPIRNGDVEMAVRRLYDRIDPLLTCRHQRTSLKRASDERVRSLSTTRPEPADGPYICKQCTAYALGGALPEVGTQ